MALVVAAVFLGAWAGVDVIDPGYGCVAMDQTISVDWVGGTPAKVMRAYDLHLQEIFERGHAGCQPGWSHMDQLGHDLAQPYGA